jgi:hypothetical protein
VIPLATSLASASEVECTSVGMSQRMSGWPRVGEDSFTQVVGRIDPGELRGLHSV